MFSCLKSDGIFYDCSRRLLSNYVFRTVVWLAIGASMEESGEIPPENPSGNGKKERKKSGSKQGSSLRTALFTCITTRQLKVVLDLCYEVRLLMPNVFLI